MLPRAIAHSTHFACFLVLFVLGACVGDDDIIGGGGGGDDGPPDRSPQEWPGGSLGGWEAGDGVDEAWTRDGEGVGREGEGYGSGGMAPSDADGDSYAGGDEYAGDADTGSTGEPGYTPDPSGDPPPAGSGLEGGQIDDNADFDGFLSYVEDALDAFGDDPMVHWVDVSRRTLVTVLDAEGRTVPDATIRVFLGEALVTDGRTHADGRFAFFPNAYPEPGDPYTIEAVAGAAFGAVKVDERDGEVEIRLNGVAPETESFAVDVAFMIDATGSMSEEIDRIKQTVSDIAGRVAESPHAPDLRLALVDYRDYGDAYVVHAVNFTRDVEAFQGSVDQLQANGGGDMPEALNDALHDAMRRLEWRQDTALRLVFIVADAPAHYYEQAPYTYDQAMLDASVMGVTFYPIASGGSDGIAELQFRQLAQFTLGHFIFITEGGGSPEGSGGSDYHVDPSDFNVQSLDDLVVGLIAEEMAAWHGEVADE